MKAKPAIALVVSVIAVLVGFYAWTKGAPRRQALETLSRLQMALNTPGGDALLQAVVAPALVRDRTTAEQAEFIRKTLQDELSAEGLAVLRRKGKFGPLKDLFPEEAATWSQQAGVDADSCVAFRMERHGLRAEVVLARFPTPGAQSSTGEINYRVVRLNNVKQLAEPILLTTNTHP